LNLNKKLLEDKNMTGQYRIFAMRQTKNQDGLIIRAVC
jgi:hypothetical protein